MASAEDESFMAGLLDEVDTNVVSNNNRAPTQNVIKSEARRKVRILSPPLPQRTRPEKREKKDENDGPISPISQ